MTSCRSVCFTINNPVDGDREWCASVECAYIVYGDEVGESGTPHIQGYIEFGRPIRFSTLKFLCPRGHFEQRKGSAKQAATYCKKDGHFTERGEISQQGKRSDLHIIAEQIIDGDTVAAVARSNPVQFIKYGRGIRALREVIQEPRDFEPVVIWLWGPAGTGKTRSATECESYYIKDNTKWWDGYDHQVRIIIDDFDAPSWNFRDLLQVLDRYACRREYKGGYVEINSREIYITCEFPPDHWWSGNSLAQVTRRIVRVRHMGL